MSFIIKLKKLTTTTTTTTTSTTTLREFSVSDSNVFISTFGAGVDNLFGDGSSSFRLALGSDTTKKVGDVEMNIVSNDSSYIDNGDGTFTFDLNIIGRLVNTSSLSRDVVIPRIGVNLGIIGNNFVKMISSFVPTDSSKKVGLVTQDRFVAEFNDIRLSPNQSKDYSVIGSLTVSRIGNQPPILDLETTDNTVSTLGYRILKPANKSSFTLVTRDIAGLITQHSENTRTIPNDSSTSVSFNYNFPDTGFIVSYAVRLQDKLIPDFLLTLNKRNGFISNVSEAEPTTAPPPPPAQEADASFVFSDPTTGTLSNPAILEIPFNDVAVLEYRIGNATSNFNNNTVPYKIRITGDEGVSVTDLDGNTFTITSNDPSFIIKTDNLNSGTEITNLLNISKIILTPAFFNVELLVDTNNDGTFSVVDELFYSVTSAPVSYITTFTYGGSTINAWTFDYVQPNRAAFELSSSNSVTDENSFTTNESGVGIEFWKSVDGSGDGSASDGLVRGQFIAKDADGNILDSKTINVAVLDEIISPSSSRTLLFRIPARTATVTFNLNETNERTTTSTGGDRFGTGDGETTTTAEGTGTGDDSPVVGDAPTGGEQ